MNIQEAASGAGLGPDELPAACRPADPNGIGVEDDFDPEGGLARWVADIEAGRCRVPEQSELEGPAVSISLGDACDLDPALLAAMCGPDGLGARPSAPHSARTTPPTCCQFPDGCDVEVRYPRVPEVEDGDRAGWPWPPGTI
jgi:hypothetical protein